MHKVSVKLKRFAQISIALLMLASTWVVAQQGHPLKGTWRGNITANGEDTRVLMIIDYDGTALQGMINPGRNSFPFELIELDSSNWTLHVEASSRDGESISFDGVLKEIGSANRYLEGNWMQDGTEYEFLVSRE